MSRIVVAALLALSFSPIGPCPAVAQDFAAWVRTSGREDNDLLIELISQGELSACLEICRAIGLRSDFRVGEVILALGGSFSRASQNELLLRVLLASVFPVGLERTELRERLKENLESLDFLFSTLSRYDLPLKREIIRLMAGLPEPKYQGMLMSEGRRITELLRRQKGRLEQEQAALIVTFLETVSATGSPDFADVVLTILERTRHPGVAEKARSVARVLLAAG